MLDGPQGRGYNNAMRIGLVLLLTGLLVHPAAAQSRFDPQKVHDPSTIVRCKDEYWLFSTGPGIVSRHSKDLVHWEAGPQVFQAPPEWTKAEIPDNRGYFWAPDVIKLGDRYLLYYSLSRFGKNTSVIGLAENQTLDTADPNFAWKDRGLVIRSGTGDNYNAIDPGLIKDADGKLWMSFGSFWSGIKLVELNPATGLRISPDSKLYSLAKHNEIEASFIYHHGDYYYLFVNWGLCCKGVNSTYNIRMGRSKVITGPYRDKAGKDMLHDGGTLFLDAHERYIGPGHAGIFEENGKFWFSHHYYDRDDNGRARLRVIPLRWDNDGWPMAENW